MRNRSEPDGHPAPSALRSCVRMAWQIPLCALTAGLFLKALGNPEVDAELETKAIQVICAAENAGMAWPVLDECPRVWAQENRCNRADGLKNSLDTLARAFVAASPRLPLAACPRAEDGQGRPGSSRPHENA